MSSFINCPECEAKILSRVGTICPNCGFTVGFFSENTKKRIYGKFFALTIFAPFISFIFIIFAQINFYSFIASILFTIYLAIKSCPIRFKDIFTTNFERVFFWSIWIILNSFLVVLIINIGLKSLKF